MTVSPSTIFPNLCLAWMDPSNGQHQAMSTHSLEDVLACPKSQQETRPRPQPEQSLRCPRCDSTNTKFCYYNNYSLTQPRYFCKACRRYWTKGGSLRNVPVGGGCRKNKRPSSSKRTPDQQHPSNNSNPFPLFSPLSYDSNDLSLSFGGLPKESTRQLGFHDHDTPILGNFNNTHCDIFGNPNTTTTSTTPGFLNSLRSGFLDVPSGFHNFTYGFGNQNMGEVESSGGEEVVLPYEEMRGAATTTATAVPTKQEFNNNGKDGENKVFWNFPWQYGGEGSMGGVDSGRECWNGLGSSWHGLVNSPLI